MALRAWMWWQDTVKEDLVVANSSICLNQIDQSEALWLGLSRTELILVPKAKTRERMEGLVKFYSWNQPNSTPLSSNERLSPGSQCHLWIHSCGHQVAGRALFSPDTSTVRRCCRPPPRGSAAFVLQGSTWSWRFALNHPQRPCLSFEKNDAKTCLFQEGLLFVRHVYENSPRTSVLGNVLFQSWTWWHGHEAKNSCISPSCPNSEKLFFCALYTSEKLFFVACHAENRHISKSLLDYKYADAISGRLFLSVWTTRRRCRWACRLLL